MEFEAPADAWYVWMGVAMAATAVAGVVLALPTAPPPDAAAAANTVDRVAASDAPATGHYDHDARRYRLGDDRLAMRNDGGVARATLAYGPVVPADEDPRLQRVLAGRDPAGVFGPGNGSFARFRATVARARTAAPTWEPANETLRVRAVRWRDARVVLVDA